MCLLTLLRPPVRRENAIICIYTYYWFSQFLQNRKRALAWNGKRGAGICQRKSGKRNLAIIQLYINVLRAAARKQHSAAKEKCQNAQWFRWINVSFDTFASPRGERKCNNMYIYAYYWFSWNSPNQETLSRVRELGGSPKNTKSRARVFSKTESETWGCREQ